MKENETAVEGESSLVKNAAADFCFYLEQDDTDGDTYAFFCPLKFFQENSSMSKEVYDILDEIIPEDMDEVQDNCYATSRSMEDVEAQLLKLGFVQDDAFDEFMSNIDELDEDDDANEEEEEEDSQESTRTGT